PWSNLCVPNVSTDTPIGCGCPMAYDSSTSTRSARPAATMFFATQRAAYDAERSTFDGSFPEYEPPPCRPTAPYVSTMFLRPESPESAAGPPSTKEPLRFT